MFSRNYCMALLRLHWPAATVTPQVAMVATQLSSWRLSGAAGCSSVAVPSAVDKNALSKLRKKTGYPFVNCRKALEMFGGDQQKAEMWLREQAEKEGWSKASKLQARPMSQGLIGVVANRHLGVMVEVNCETDFVAKNIKFQNLVAAVASACWQSVEQRLVLTSASPASARPSQKIILTSEEILPLITERNQTLKDTIIAEIGSLGENMAVRRAIAMAAAGTEHVSHYVHLASPLTPEKGADGAVLFGKYAALVLIRPAAAGGDTIPSNSMQFTGMQLGQHVVGMSPRTLDDLEHPEDDLEHPEGTSAVNGAAKVVRESQSLLHQEFLMDASQTVAEWLLERGVEVLDFARLEVGCEEAAVSEAAPVSRKAVHAAEGSGVNIGASCATA